MLGIGERYGVYSMRTQCELGYPTQSVRRHTQGRAHGASAPAALPEGLNLICAPAYRDVREACLTSLSGRLRGGARPSSRLPVTLTCLRPPPVVVSLVGAPVPTFSKQSLYALSHPPHQPDLALVSQLFELATPRFFAARGQALDVERAGAMRRVREAR